MNANDVSVAIRDYADPEYAKYFLQVLTRKNIELRIIYLPSG